MKKRVCILIGCMMIPLKVYSQELFGSGINSSIYLTPMAMASGDFNRDGIADIVVCGKNDLDGSGIMSVLFGKGDGGFKSKIDMSTDKYAVNVVVTDMDNDGLEDIVTANRESQTVTIFMNQKSGGFKAKDPIKIKGEPGFIGVGDFTKDGKPDIAVIVPSSKEMLIYKGTSYKLVATDVLEAAPVSLIVKDLAGSGLSHALISFEGLSNVALIAPAEISSKEWRFHKVKLDMLTTPHFAQLNDINGDGYNDAVILKSGGKELAVHLAEAGGLILDDIHTLKIPDGIAVFTMGDFNNDKKPDIAVLDSINTQVVIYLNQSTGAFTSSFVDAKAALIYENDSSKPNSFDMGMMSSYKNASMIIYNEAAKPVRKYFEFESDLPDEQQFALEWNGLDENDAAMPDGKYVFYYKLGAVVVARVVKK